MFPRILHGLPSQWLPRGPQVSLERAWRRRVRLLFGSESFDSNRWNHIVDVVEKQLQVTFNASLCIHVFHIHETSSQKTVSHRQETPWRKACSSYRKEELNNQQMNLYYRKKTFGPSLESLEIQSEIGTLQSALQIICWKQVWCGDAERVGSKGL